MPLLAYVEVSISIGSPKSSSKSGEIQGKIGDQICYAMLHDYQESIFCIVINGAVFTFDFACTRKIIFLPLLLI